MSTRICLYSAVFVFVSMFVDNAVGHRGGDCSECEETAHLNIDGSHLEALGSGPSIIW